MAEGFPTLVLREIATLLIPLRLVAESADPATALQRLMHGVGWRTRAAGDVAAVTSVVQDVASILDDLRADPIPDSLEEVVELLESIADLAEDVRNLGESLASAAPGPVTPDASAAFAEDLVHYLLLRRLRRAQPLYEILEILGFVGTVAVDAVDLGGWLERPAGNVARLQSEALPAFLEAPIDQLLGRVVNDGWANPADAIATNFLLLRFLAPALARLGGRFRMHPRLFDDSASFEARGRTALLELGVATPLGSSTTVGVVFELLSAADATPGGAAGPAATLTPFGSFEGALTVRDWTVGLILTTSVEEPFTVGVGGVEAPAGFAAVAEVTAGRPLDLTIGGATTGLYLGALEVGLSAGVVDGSPDYGFSVAATGSEVRFDTADLGRALDALLPFDATFEFDLGVAWSRSAGLTLVGRTSLDLPIADELSMFGGAVVLSNVRLELSVSDEVEAEVLLGLSLTLGPVSLVFGDFGLGAVLSFDEARGNLGASNLALDPLLPTTLGIGFDSDVATGGGVVTVDYDAGEYAAVLSVEVLGVGVTAVGLLTTELPDGSAGYSMFLALSATFTGVQLGFGFTLNGVGGLIGLNRGLDPEALGDGIRTGALDSILFPDDPVGDALRILSDIEAIFPTQVGQSVVGPVAKLGWGTPTLIEADLGVIVQFPDPLALTLLGSLGAALPDEDAPLLVLNIDVAGTFDPGAGTIAIDASLRDSQVVGLSLSGDMAMRASFLDDPSFLLSFGGFNPHFSPPADFPTLNRLSVSLETGNALRIGLWGYFALTSNTVQFGAGADLWAKAVGLTVEGHFSFDALIQFNPFLFIIDLGFSVDVRAGSVELFGVHLDLMLEGPNPFHVVGTATMKILGIKTSFELDETIGKKEVEPPKETVYAQQEVIAALGDSDAWREAPPDADALPVTFAEDDGAGVRVHPAGSLEVVQRVVPLKRTLDKVGAAKLGDLDRFELLSPTIGGEDATAEDVEDYFPSAQFFDMGDDDKLSAPSFDRMPAGLRFGDPSVDAPKPHAFTLDYEQIVRDPDLQEADARPDALFSPDVRALAIAVKSSAVGRTRKAAGLTTSRTKTSPFAIAETAWVVADVATGAVDADLTPAGVSWTEAREAALTTRTEDARVLTPVHEAA